MSSCEVSVSSIRNSSELLERSNCLPRKANKIAIKMNLCDYRYPDSGAITDKYILDIVLGSLTGRYPDSEIFLVENDATSALADIVFRLSGVEKLTNKYHNVKLVNLQNTKGWIRKRIDGYAFKEIEIPELLEESDLIVTFPKLKTHLLTKMSCGLKNMFGCHRRRRKIIYHKALDEAIVDINLAIRPNLSIVDANVCQETVYGPAYGIPKKLGILIVGRDIVAVDSFCARLLGFRPASVGHVRKSAKAGIGTMDYAVQLLDNESKLIVQNSSFDFNRSLYYLFKLASKIGF